ADRERWCAEVPLSECDRFAKILGHRGVQRTCLQSKAVVLLTEHLDIFRMLMGLDMAVCRRRDIIVSDCYNNG
ncbi:hypothetical protein, partial [Xylella fastidiosa]|uniref:hypothetical protein n=1 Tax=Xylella fastidiosa TaxID=2371 RepID=UPI001EEC05FB